jgi:hypothetical protein
LEFDGIRVEGYDFDLSMKDLAPNLSEMYQTDVGIGKGNRQRERESRVRNVLKVVDRKESEELLKILNVCFHLQLLQAHTADVSLIPLSSVEC